MHYTQHATPFLLQVTTEVKPSCRVLPASLYDALPRPGHIRPVSGTKPLSTPQQGVNHMPVGIGPKTRVMPASLLEPSHRSTPVDTTAKKTKDIGTASKSTGQADSNTQTALDYSGIGHSAVVPRTRVMPDSLLPGNTSNAQQQKDKASAGDKSKNADVDHQAAMRAVLDNLALTGTDEVDPPAVSWQLEFTVMCHVILFHVRAVLLCRWVECWSSYAASYPSVLVAELPYLLQAALITFDDARAVTSQGI